MYILKYICLYILHFILLFTSSLPFYNFLQVIGVVIGVGWFVTSTQSEEKERASAGLTSDISLGSLAFNDNAFSVRSRLCFESKVQLNTVVHNILSYRSVSRSKTL